MDVVEGQGCLYMPMEDIHGCRWMQGTINGDRGTGMRQEVSILVIMGCVCTPNQPRDKQQTGLSRRCKGGYSSHECSHEGRLWGKNSPTKTDTNWCKHKSKRKDKERTGIKLRHTYKDTKYSSWFTPQNQKNKQNEQKQNPQHQIITSLSQGQKSRTRKTTKNAHRQQKNTHKTKARKNSTQTTTLFVLTKLLQVRAEKT